MSKSYFIEISLKAVLDECCIYKLLERGQKLGFLYLDRRDYCDYLPNVKEHLSIDQAVKNVLISHQFQSMDNDMPVGLAIFYQDIYFIIIIRPENENLKMILMPIMYDWTKTYENEEYFDFGRYTNLLINFCADFPILDIRTRTDL